ncbi:Fur family transcriptional regulator [Prosthecochloris sp. GSB1]|uniref:Fur family transcriptional regulator n=1 Tax=Prosthecochloris sp. GSB1 TaxID=281093 RepID=UPI000B8C946C|nr:Fur family transcriptional regulator [Prosthecochloris sp. GSB1]ASQ89674.1 Fur family transcriptional regulator [Prosthecochloris sp. GSB1]
MEELLGILRGSGFRVTPRRRAIVELFMREGSVLSPSDVFDALRSSMVKCGLPGIYRNLETLVSCGILFRVVSFSGERRYALCRPEPESRRHHHHIVCVSCGKVGRVQECRYRDGMRIDGFRLVSHIVQLNGLCASCAEKEDGS